VHDLGRPEGLRRQYLSLVRAVERDGPFDVLHAYWALPAGVVTALAGRKLGIPVVVTADSGEFVALPEIDYGQQRQWQHRLAVALATRLATRVTVCSRLMERQAKRHGCAPTVIPLGVDSRKYPPSSGEPTTSTELRDDHTWRLLHVASLNRVKDQPLLLDAFRRVVDSTAPQRVHLDIVGEDTLNGVIQARARTLGLTGDVTFQGWLASDELIPFYRRSDAVVITSRHEAACVVALEAAAAGVPVVGTSVGYLDDWSPHAAVVAPRDAGALAEAITGLLRQPARRRELAAAAQSWSVAHDADWTASQFEQLYAELSSRRA
jgi:glycosyltransferase involved in cell wall biosynthesis